MYVTRILAGAALLAGLATVPAWAQADYRSSERDDYWSQSHQGADQGEQYPMEAGRSAPEYRSRSEMPRYDRSARAGFRYSPDLRRAAKLIGEPVVDVNAKEVGTIDDLVVDSDHGVVGYAIIARGGVLGINERLVPVPFKALRQPAPGEKVTLQTDGDLLDHVPAIQKGDFSVMNDPQWARDLFSQFNLQPYWVSMQRTRGTARGEVYGYTGGYEEYPPAPQSRREQRERMREPERYGSERDRGAYSRSEMEAGPAVRDRERQVDRERGRRARGTREEPGRLEMIRASKILDKKIEGADGEKIGDLDDLMVDMKTGGVTYAVISEEKLFSDKLHAVPWTVFDVTERRGRPTLVVNMVEDDLRAAPAFEKGNWPDMSSPRWTERIHRYYGAEPTWTYYGFVEAAAAGQHEVRFERQTVRTIQGTVQRMSRYGRLGEEDDIVRLQLAVSPGQPAQPGATTQPSAATRPAEARRGEAVPGREEMVTVYLAPLSYIRDQGISFSHGDTVTVEGSQVVLNGEPVILASTLTKEGKTVQLRNDQGEPLWTRTGEGEMQEQERTPESPRNR